MYGSGPFYFMKILSMALDVGCIGITKRAAFSRLAIIRHMRSINTRHFKSARIYGEHGGRSTNVFGGLIGQNCKILVVEWHGFKYPFQTLSI